MPDYYIFQDESGQPNDEFFFNGIIIKNKNTLPLLYEIINETRLQYNFYDELHFQKMSHKRCCVYYQIIERALTEAKFKQSTIIVCKKHLDMKYFSNKEHLAYNFFTYLLIYHNIKYLRGNIYIYPDYKNRVLEDNFIDYLKDRLNSEAIINKHRYFVKAVEPRSSENEEMIQLNDLIIGAIRQKYIPSSGKWKKTLSDKIFQIRNSTWHYKDKINIWDWKPYKRK